MDLLGEGFGGGAAHRIIAYYYPDTAKLNLFDCMGWINCIGRDYTDWQSQKNLHCS